MKQALLAMVILMAIARFNQDSGKPFAFKFNSVQKKPIKLKTLFLNHTMLISYFCRLPL